MAAKKKTALIAGLLVGAALVGGCLLSLQTPPEIEWKFLQGIEPTQDEFQEFGWLMEGGTLCTLASCPNDGPPTIHHAQEYVYRADYKRVAALATTEALAHGGEIVHQTAYTSLITRGKWFIYVTPGKYDPLTGNTDGRAPYVRVTVLNTHGVNAVGRGWRLIRSYFPH
ncbi:MAG: hypothetical protein ACAH95_13630 [Fimbriimonas sp.]